MKAFIVKQQQEVCGLKYAQCKKKETGQKALQQATK